MDQDEIFNRSALSGADHIELALRTLGEILAAQNHSYSVVVIGGSALVLLGFVERPTRDVDILAFGMSGAEFPPAAIVEPPVPLPAPLMAGVRLVAQELTLTPDWLNSGPALQWKQGLPPGLERRIHWRRYGALTVGLVDRYDLIFFKLFAAADAIGPESRHYQDLRRLSPTAPELAAAAWVREQDGSPDFARVVDRVLEYARTDLVHDE